jgi:glycine/D-amino acid oxidase-like deaminating enzyme
MPSKPKIAIIGAGFSGLAAAWFLLEHPSPVTSVTLFSDGREASQISAGLLHKYVGLKSTLNPFAHEGEKKTIQLLEVAKTALGEPVILSKGMLRIALKDHQKEDFYQCASQNEDVEWLEPAQIKALNPFLPDAPGIFIHSGMLIDSGSYLEGLKKACIQKGLLIEKKHIADLSELKSFDFIILATGAHSFNLHNLKVFPVKGQLLELEWPSDSPPLPFAINSQVYIAMTKDKNRCIVGATHEHHFRAEDPDQKAVEDLYPKALELYPPLKEAKVLNVKAACRCTTSNRLPFAGLVQDNVYAITGMGSRGLLYHAYFAEQLVNRIPIDTL